MPDSICCPAMERYRELLCGKMSPSEGEPLIHHVQECERCAEAVKRLLATDTVGEMVRHQTLAGSDQTHSLVEQLLARLGCTALAPAARPSPHANPTLPPPTSPEPQPLGGPTTDHGNEESPDRGAAGSFADMLAPAQGPDELGRLGTYRVLKVLGAGGMGVVFKAEDPQLQRPVALKAMLPALAARPIAQQRFLREARAAAGIKNDHVVSIYQVGEERGVPFLAMEFLEGETLDERLRREGKLSPGEVVRIGREMADGLAAAHARGLIHRDIKPANVWLESPKSRVKILDFGLARAAEESQHLTQQGVIVGTPGFMAPEQARGGAVDARCDLFSLGCLLYWAAVGQPAFDGRDTISTLLAVATHNPRPPCEFNALFSPELSDLILKLLAKDPAKRFQSAAEVAVALERLAPASPGSGSAIRPVLPPQRSGMVLPPATVKDQQRPALTPGSRPMPKLPLPTRVSSKPTLHPISPPASGTEVFPAAPSQTTHSVVAVPAPPVPPKPGRWGRWVIGAAAVAGLGVLAGILCLPARDRSPSSRTSNAGSRTARGETANLPTWTGPSPLDGLQPEKIPESERTAAGGGDSRKAPARLVAIWGDSWLKHRGGVYSVAFSPNGKILASASYDKTVKLWNLETRQEERTLEMKETARCLSFSPNGSLLACGGENGTIRIWNLESKQEQTLAAHKGGVRALAFRGDGQALASGGLDQLVKLWDLGTGKDKPTEKLTPIRHSQAVGSLAFPPEGQLLVSGSDDGTLKVWDTKTGQVRSPSAEQHGSKVLRVAFHRDGQKFASAAADGTVKVWESGTLTASPPLRLQPALAAAFTPDLKTVAWGAGTGVVLLWDLATKKEQRLEGHRGDIHSLAFSPDGRMLASGSDDSTLKVWDPETGTERLPSRGHALAVTTLAFSADARLLASGSNDHTVKLWDTATGEVKHTLTGHHGEVVAVAISSQGEMLATASLDHTVRLWDRITGKELFSLGDKKQATTSLAFSPDGKLLAGGCSDGTVKLWSLDHGKGDVRSVTVSPKAAVTAVAFSPDGKLVAAGCSDGIVKFWDPAGTDLVPLGADSDSGVRCVAFSPDSKEVAAGYERKRIRRWDIASRQKLTDLSGHQGGIRSIAFSPDGKTLASSADDAPAPTLRIWDLDTGKPKESFPLHCGGGTWGAGVNQVAFSPDGRHLATGNGNGTIYIFRLALPPGKDSK